MAGMDRAADLLAEGWSLEEIARRTEIPASDLRTSIMLDWAALRPKLCDTCKRLMLGRLQSTCNYCSAVLAETPTTWRTEAPSAGQNAYDLPSPDEIARRAAEIRASWSAQEELERRAGGKRIRARIPRSRDSRRIPLLFQVIERSPE
jgi:hypothetical protein